MKIEWNGQETFLLVDGTDSNQVSWSFEHILESEKSGKEAQMQIPGELLNGRSGNNLNLNFRRWKGSTEIIRKEYPQRESVKTLHWRVSALNNVQWTSMKSIRQECARDSYQMQTAIESMALTVRTFRSIFKKLCSSYKIPFSKNWRNRFRFSSSLEPQSPEVSNGNCLSSAELQRHC